MTTEATLDRMIVRERVEIVARRLFPESIADGGDCRAETGREGEPGSICADRNAKWVRIVARVQDAMFEAFR